MGRNGQRYLWWTPLVTVCASPSESPYRYCADLAGQETLRTCSRTFGDRSTPRDWAKLLDAVLLSKTTAKSDSLGYNSSLRRDFPAWFHANGSQIGKYLYRETILLASQSLYHPVDFRLTFIPRTRLRESAFSEQLDFFSNTRKTGISKPDDYPRLNPFDLVRCGDVIFQLCPPKLQMKRNKSLRESFCIMRIFFLLPTGVKGIANISYEQMLRWA